MAEQFPPYLVLSTAALLSAEIQRDAIVRLQWQAEALSRASCRRQGIDPDAIIDDDGHAAWELVGYEDACREMPPP